MLVNTEGWAEDELVVEKDVNASVLVVVSGEVDDEKTFVAEDHEEDEGPILVLELDDCVRLCEVDICELLVGLEEWVGGLLVEDSNFTIELVDCVWLWEVDVCELLVGLGEWVGDLVVEDPDFAIELDDCVRLWEVDVCDLLLELEGRVEAPVVEDPDFTIELDDCVRLWEVGVCELLVGLEEWVGDLVVEDPDFAIELDDCVRLWEVDVCDLLLELEERVEAPVVEDPDFEIELEDKCVVRDEWEDEDRDLGWELELVALVEDELVVVLDLSLCLLELIDDVSSIVELDETTWEWDKVWVFKVCKRGLVRKFDNFDQEMKGRFTFACVSGPKVGSTLFLAVLVLEKISDFALFADPKATIKRIKKSRSWGIFFIGYLMIIGIGRKERRTLDVHRWDQVWAPNWEVASLITTEKTFLQGLVGVFWAEMYLRQRNNVANIFARVLLSFGRAKPCGAGGFPFLYIIGIILLFWVPVPAFAAEWRSITQDMGHRFVLYNNA
jgi:hypothetical protein